MLREKYFDEQFPAYFVFGTRPEGLVDLSDGQNDVYEGITPELATKIMHERDSMISGLYKLLNKLDDPDTKMNSYDLMMDLKQDILSVPEPEYYKGCVISENKDPNINGKYQALKFNESKVLVYGDDIDEIKYHLDNW